MTATHHYFSTINHINITTDESALVNSEDYIAIRKEIGGWFPGVALSPGIHRDCLVSVFCHNR